MPVAAMPWAPVTEEPIRKPDGSIMLTAEERDNAIEQMEFAFREAESAISMFPADRQYDPRQVNWRATIQSPKHFRRFKEAVSESSMPQLLRMGVQSLLFDAYAAVGVTYPDLVRMVDSSGYEELYAPLYGAEVPKTVLPGQKYEDSRLMGLDYRLKNIKKGRMLSIERELVEDDQTGQITQRASQLGEKMRYVEQQTVDNAIVGATYSTAIGNLLVTPGTTTAAPGELSQPNLQQMAIQMMTILDPLGNLMLVQPDTLYVSPVDTFVAAQLLGSALQPSVPGSAGQTASSASSGGTGWTMTMNPLQGRYALKESRFLPVTGLDTVHGPWFLMQAKTSIVFQNRTPMQVIPEAFNAGGSFERDHFRWRVDRRFNAGVVESRFIGRGN